MFLRKIWTRCMGVIGLLLILPSFASAQLTLLPQPSEDADCNQLLINFELTGLIPTVTQSKVEKALQAVNNYEAAKQAYEDAVAEVDPGQGIDCSMTPDSPACQEMKAKEQEMKDAEQQAVDAANEAKANENNQTSERDNLLGCAIKTGRVSLAMIPYFITYISNFILAIIGLIVVLMIVIGGYQYVYGGLADQKEKGKKTITSALMGMSVAFLAWVIVNIVIAAITG